MKMHEFLMLDALVSNSIEARKAELRRGISINIDDARRDYIKMVGEEPPRVDYSHVEYKPKRYTAISTILSMIFGSFGVLYASALGGAIAIGLMATAITITVSITQEPIPFLKVYFLLRVAYVVLAVYFTRKTNEKHEEDIKAINESKNEAVKLRMEEIYKKRFKKDFEEGRYTKGQIQELLERIIKKEMSIEDSVRMMNKLT